MSSRVGTFLLLLVALGGCWNVAAAVEAKLPAAGYAAVGGRTLMPYGWRDFCGRRPEACAVEALEAVDIHVTPSVWE